VLQVTVAGTMEACVKAANSSSVEMGKCAKDQMTRRGTVKSPAKEALEAVSGKTVTDVEVTATLSPVPRVTIVLVACLAPQ